jgi:hypothetical protein
MTRLTHRLFGAPLLRNSIREEYVQEMVAQALAPEWLMPAPRPGQAIRGAAKLVRRRIATAAPPNFIAHKTGRYDGLTWIAEHSRNAEIFIFGWHGIADATADHREPAQWLFYVVPETALPAQASLSLAALARLGDPVDYDGLRARVADVATAINTTASVPPHKAAPVPR